MFPGYPAKNSSPVTVDIIQENPCDRNSQFWPETTSWINLISYSLIVLKWVPKHRILADAGQFFSFGSCPASHSHNPNRSSHILYSKLVSKTSSTT